MCSSKSKTRSNMIPETIARINGRPVLQPKSNQVPTLERRNPLKKKSPKSQTPPPTPSPLPPARPTKTAKTNASLSSPPFSPKSKSPRQPALKRGKDASNELCSSVEKAVFRPKPVGTLKKAKSFGGADPLPLKHSSSLIAEKPGSIAAARREEVAMKQEQRKTKIAHYGRTKSSKLPEKKVDFLDSSSTISTNVEGEKKRCSFITPNSDPLYVSYHDEEWGVPVRDDKLLFELLVLTGAQVGSDWSSVLKRRQFFREVFSEFDAELVAKYNEKIINSITSDYGVDLTLVLAAVDNSKQILKVKREFGSFDKYLWRFVNNKAIVTQYKSRQKIPVKTSKSETISKDMVRRGFRFVGPTVIYSFMQAAGLTNDHLVTCPRHLQCIALASQPPAASPAP